MRLFGRTWLLTVGGTDLTDLDLAFKVERTTRRTLGSAEIRVWNLSRSTRATVEAAAAEHAVVVLRAGLGNAEPPVIFRGDARQAFTARDARTDLVTTIVARDGGTAFAEGRTSRSYAPGTPVSTVLRDVVHDLGIGEGNLADYLSSLTLRNGAQGFGDGFVAAGPARRLLDHIIRGAGLRWSIQGGALQIQARGAPLPARAVVLSADTGLVESPTWDEAGRRSAGRRGVCTAKVLIQPGIEPGKRVRLESEIITGDFEVRKAVYAGDTRGNDWYATLELRATS